MLSPDEREERERQDHAERHVHGEVDESTRDLAEPERFEAAIYGIEETDGVQALVLELVEGPTLADRIAEALEAAHDAGVIHRI